jgi:hypothetical protein
MRGSLRLRLRRLAFWLVAAAAGAVFFGAVSHHVYTVDFKPLAAFCLPVLVVFFGFTSLLYMRGRSLARGKAQVRTLFAAERTMQGTIAYLSGIVLGTSLYGLWRYLDFHFDPSQPTASGAWLLLFLAPYALMQAGFVLFMSGMWTIVPQLLRPVSPYEVWRRIGKSPLDPPTVARSIVPSSPDKGTNHGHLPSAGHELRPLRQRHRTRSRVGGQARPFGGAHPREAGSDHRGGDATGAGRSDH